MLSLAAEIERLRPFLGNARTDAALARERREVVSLHPELRIAAWAGVMLLVASAGIILKNNLDRLGPVVLAALLSLAAAACYAWVTWHRDRATLADDYVLLLGALLLSADIAFIETQFHVLGEAWRQHLLLIAILHAVTAYAFRSRVVLSLAITSLAAWIGVNQRYTAPREFAEAAFVCAAALLVWRELDRRFTTTGFTRTFEHFAANLALLGGLALLDRDITLGSLVTIVIAVAIIVWGFRTKNEWFVLYAFLYAVLAMDILLIHLVDDDAFSFFLVLISTVGSIVGLFRIHAKFKEIAR
jgi:hypothetical protein